MRVFVGEARALSSLRSVIAREAGGRGRVTVVLDLPASEVEIAQNGECAAPDLCITLLLDASTIGVLRARPRVPGQFGVEHRRVLERIAPKLAIAVALARRIAAE